MGAFSTVSSHSNSAFSRPKSIIKRNGNSLSARRGRTHVLLVAARVVFVLLVALIPWEVLE